MYPQNGIKGKRETLDRIIENYLSKEVKESARVDNEVFYGKEDLDSNHDNNNEE